MAFDKSLPFATVIDNTNPVAFVQGGFGFNFECKLLGKVDEFNNVLVVKVTKPKAPVEEAPVEEELVK